MSHDQRKWTYGNLSMPHEAFSKLAACVSPAIGGKPNPIKADKFKDMLAEEGYIVPCVGGYSATRKGVEFWREATVSGA